MAGKLLIDAHYPDEARVAVISELGELEFFETEYLEKKPIKGNIYLAKIVRIEPSIQAAFIEYGGEKHGFLPLSEIHFSYFNENTSRVNKDVPKQALEDGKTPKKKPRRKISKIQEVIAANQVVLVQAEKEIRGNKCAFFSTFISLPGRYCILTPNPPKGKGNAVSKKIVDAEKERLKDVIKSLDIPEGMGCIVRTAGANRTKNEIKRDLDYLLKLWNKVRSMTASSTSPCLLHEEGNIVKRSIRDLYQRSMDSIVIQGENAHKEARAFMRMFTPSHMKKIKLYSDTERPIFNKYEIEDKIGSMLFPVIELPSGGSIVINTTEALTAIDVNSGKSKNNLDIENTALRTDLEAIVEIAKQIKLRDISGIIIVDFIDVSSRQAIDKIEKKMRDAMKNDYSSIQIGKLSQFGLMEISRQRLRMSLVDSNFIQCPHCRGAGKILSQETVAISVIRKIENDLIDENAKHIVAEVASGIDLFILNHKRKLLKNLEDRYEVFIEIMHNPSFIGTDCKVTVKVHKIS
ncbi:MAG: ribonuclease E/G [Holosporales bacterium]|nr:ribonuclease E/G [Holosporales bacterium]